MAGLCLLLPGFHKKGRILFISCFLMSCGCSHATCLASMQQSHHHVTQACCCSLMSCKLPLLRRKACSTDAVSSCTSSSLAQSPPFLLCSFSSTWSSAVNFLGFCVARLNWMQAKFHECRFRTQKESTIQLHVQEAQWHATEAVALIFDLSTG